MAFQNVHSPVEAPKEYTDKYAFINDTIRRTYAGMVDIMDEAVGNITEAFKEAGYWKCLLINQEWGLYRQISNWDLSVLTECDSKAIMARAR